MILTSSAERSRLDPALHSFAFIAKADITKEKILEAP